MLSSFTTTTAPRCEAAKAALLSGVRVMHLHPWHYWHCFYSGDDFADGTVANLSGNKLDV